MEDRSGHSTGRKSRASKRSKRSKPEAHQVVPKRRTRASTMTQAEILETTALFGASPSLGELAAPYSMTQSTASEVTQTGYSRQAQTSPYQTMPRSATATHTSSAYSQPIMPPASVASTMSQRSTARMPPTQSSSRYSGRTPTSEVTGYHAMAERTRAATKMLQSRYSARTRMADQSTYTPSERAAVDQPNTSSGSSVGSQLPNVSISQATRQHSATGYNTQRAIHNLPIPTAPTMDRYWFRHGTKTPETPQNPANIIRNSKTTQSEITQTDISITEMEMKLLKILKAKQMDPSKISITIDENDYTVIYTQCEEKKVETNSIHNLMRSSDLIKTSLLKYYNNALENSSTIELPLPSTSGVSQPQYTATNSEENNWRKCPKTCPSEYLQNEHQEHKSQNQHLIKLLLENQRTNDGNADAVTNTTVNKEEINIPGTSIPEVQNLPISTAGGRHVDNNNNARHNHHRQQGSRASHSRSNMNPNRPLDFLRYTPYTDPCPLPPFLRQPFGQHGWPRWF